MTTPQDGIRKAAILVASLDRKAAILLLDEMTPEQASLVREAAEALGTLDAREQRRVIDEFRHVGPMVPEKDPPGIELDGRFAGKLPRRAAVEESAGTPEAKERPFLSLHDAESENLARMLAPERPQTIAVVLSHLPSAQAGNLLARLAPELQTEVIHRLVDLEDTDPEILRDIEGCLHSRLASQVTIQRQRVVGPAAVAGILRASNLQAGRAILENLAAADPSLAARLAPVNVAFDDLIDLDNDSLRMVLDAVEPELLSLALTGEEESIVARLLGQLPRGRVERIRRQLDDPGPTRLSDVEQARQRIAAVARRLLMEGRIEKPRASQAMLAAA